MPTVGSWWVFEEVMCSAITALIQWTSPCVGFWPCTLPTGIVPAASVPLEEVGRDPTSEMCAPIEAGVRQPLPLALADSGMLLLFVSVWWIPASVGGVQGSEIFWKKGIRGIVIVLCL